MFFIIISKIEAPTSSPETQAESQREMDSPVPSQEVVEQTELSIPELDFEETVLQLPAWQTRAIQGANNDYQGANWYGNDSASMNACDVNRVGYSIHPKYYKSSTIAGSSNDEDQQAHKKADVEVDSSADASYESVEDDPAYAGELSRADVVGELSRANVVGDISRANVVRYYSRANVVGDYARANAGDDSDSELSDLGTVSSGKRTLNKHCGIEELTN